MFVGHGLLAFAIAASVARRYDWPSDRALSVGILAALFATLPDVDMVYAVLGLLSGAEGLFAVSDAFWGAASVVHRAVTHSLVIGVVAAAGFTAWRVRDTPVGLAVAVGLFGVILASVGAVGGGVALAIVGVFLLGGLGIVHVARIYDHGPRTVLATALLGLLSHPFGDLVTGTPPQFLYPVDATVIASRVTLHPDPTLHLLGAFFVELSVIWLAVFTYARLRGWRLLPRVRRRAALGVGYAGAIFAIPSPTLQLSWPFVFTVLGVGMLGVPSRLRGETDDHWYTLVTALTAVTLAALAYASAYLLLVT